MPKSKRNSHMSLSDAIYTSVKFALVGAGIGAGLGIGRVALFGSTDIKESYPTSLRQASHVQNNDELWNAMVELSYLRHRAPVFFDTLCRSMDRLLLCETTIKEKSASGDRKAVAHWRMQSKLASDAALKSTRLFRSVIEADMPQALTVFDESASCVQDVIDACLHNILMESTSMIT